MKIEVKDYGQAQKIIEILLDNGYGEVTIKNEINLYTNLYIIEFDENIEVSENEVAK